MGDSETNSKRFEALCDVLLEGFHAAAQPLTMLRAALSADCAAVLPEAELRELAGTCSQEAERLTRTFRCLKRLVQSYRYPSVLGRVEVAEMLKSGIPETAANGEGKPIPVHVHVSPELPAVKADRDATVDMLQTLVDAMAAYCDADDLLVVRGIQQERGVQLTIASGCSSLNTMPGEFKVALPLASIRMELQEGKATWSTSPMTLELTFAIA